MNQLQTLNKIVLFNYFFIFFIFDLLFLPNFFASTPISFFLLLLIAPYILKPHITKFYIYVVLSIIMMASILNGLMISNVGFDENLKRFIQIMLIMLIALMNYSAFKFEFIKGKLNLFVIIFSIYLTGLLLLSGIFPDIYLKYMKLISPNSIDMIASNVETFRFSYFFSDPNTLGYFLVLILVYFLNYFKFNFLNLVLFSNFLILIISTQSRGALLAAFVVVLLSALRYARFNIRTFYLFLFSSIFFMISLYFLNDYINFIFDAFEKRSEIEEAMGSGLGGGRADKYIYFLNHFNFYPYGTGYSLFIDGKEFRPHSDLIRLVSSYGLLFCILFLFLFLPNNYKTLVLMSSFMFPFLINTIIDDYRLFGLFVLFFIYMKSDISQIRGLK